MAGVGAAVTSARVTVIEPAFCSVCGLGAAGFSEIWDAGGVTTGVVGVCALGTSAKADCLSEAALTGAASLWGVTISGFLSTAGTCDKATE
ncbi:hypothetical protein PspLS_08749 [Pyricularia sp. CBS 133598]|nr:hypothetical protein PspLS_08749 [Pyricularia sp. CBS 133598]